MKSLYLSTFCLGLLIFTMPIHCDQASPEPVASRYGLHGMLLFSDGKELIASHLPMFHFPHDFQIIFSVRLVNESLNKRLVSYLASNNIYWTIEPEQFDLNLLTDVQGGGVHRYSADIYQGHFERGGKKRFSNQIVEVKKFIMRKLLTTQLPTKHHYLRITAIDAPIQYYALVIEGRPGVDRIIRIEHSLGNTKQLPDDFYLPIDSKLIEKTLAERFNLEYSAIQTLYQESGDLL